MNIAENEINSGVRKSRLSATFFKAHGEDGDKTWLQSAVGSVADKFSKIGRDIKTYLNSVAGGARVLFEKVTQGDWGFFRQWFDEAPLLPKLAGTGAALLSGAVIVFVGGAVAGSVVGGVKATAASLGLTNSLLLGGALPGIMTSVIGAVEWAYNFDWAVPDSSLVAQCKDAIANIYEPLGDALGQSAAAIIAGRFGKRVASPETEVDIELFACYLIINPSLEDEIVSALTGLLASMKQIAYEILFLQTYKGVRQIAAELTGNEDWGADGQEPFTISQKVEEVYEKFKASEYLGHLTDAQWEGIESFGESFAENLKDYLVDEDTYVNWRRRRYA